jgi:hypothetical protein
MIWSHIQPCVIVGPTVGPRCAYGPTIHSHVATWAPPPHGPTEQNQWALQCRFFSSSAPAGNSTRAGAPFSSRLLRSCKPSPQSGLLHRPIAGPMTRLETICADTWKLACWRAYLAPATTVVYMGAGVATASMDLYYWRLACENS